MSLIDADHQLLPDVLVLPLLWLGLDRCNQWSLFASPAAALWGAVAGDLSLWSLYWLFKLVTGKEGMGYGDFKLLALIGAWGVAGAAADHPAVLAGRRGARPVAAAPARRRPRTPIPFGPYLAIAGWIALLWGETITAGYLRIAGMG